MVIKIGVVGLIREGDMKGWYVKIEEASKGGHLILFKNIPDFRNIPGSVGYDHWVHAEHLADYVLACKWEVEWLDSTSRELRGHLT